MGKDVCCDTCERFSGLEPPAEPDAPPLAIERRAIRILVRTRGGEERVHVPTSDTIVFGRVQGNDVVLPSGTISKRQFQIQLVENRVVVQDRKSTCGTYVNGRKISTPTELREGGVIYAGDFEIRVERG